MTLEQANLAAVALLSIALALLTIVAHNSTLGGASLRGNRDGAAEPTGVTGRIVRAHANLNASLLPFAILVLIGAVLHVSGRATATAAEVFLAARVAHAGLYVASVAILRSLAFYVGVGATVAFAVALPWPITL